MKINFNQISFCVLLLISGCQPRRQGKIFLNEGVCFINQKIINFNEVKEENDILINIKLLTNYHMFLVKEINRSQVCYREVIDKINI